MSGGTQVALLAHAAPAFRLTYEELLWKLLRRGKEELNERTGHRILALPPVSFNLDLSSHDLPVCGLRRLHPRTAAAEVAWFLSGDRDVSWLRKYARIWDKFTEADGQTIHAAYGYRWRHAFGRDQLALALDALSDNSSDRRIYVANWDPREDGLGAEGQKNVPCPLGFTLSVLDGQLNSQLTLRSSDVFVGLPYDVMGHALLMDAIAADLGVELGTMGVALAHPHLYDVHYGMAEEAMATQWSESTLRMPGLSTQTILRDRDGYVGVLKSLSGRVDWPAYNPLPEVVE